MPTPALIDEMIKYLALQQANTQELVRFGALRFAGDLVEAAKCGAALQDALRRQIDLTEPLNEKMAGEGGQPLAAPHKQFLNVMLMRADIVESLGQATDADKLRERAMELAQNLGNAEFAERQRQLAGAYLERGRLGEAFSVLMSARDLFSKIDKLSEADCITDLAGAYEWLRDFVRALDTIEEAKICLKDAGVVGETTARLPTGELLDMELEQMLRLQHGVRADAVLSKLFQCEARCKQYLARRNVVAGNTDNAQTGFEQARALFDRARPMVPAVAHPALDYQLALMLVDAGENAAGLDAIERLEPLFQSRDLQRRLATLLNLKARALQGLDRMAEALAVIQEAERKLEGFEDPDQDWRVYARVGEIRASLGQNEEALEAYLRATKLIDLLRRAPLGYRLDSLSLENKIPVFRQAISVAREIGDAREICRLIEMLKSRQLAVTLSAPRGTGVESELSRSIDAITNKMASIDYQGEGGADLETKTKERDKLLERMRLADPRWRSVTESEPLDIDRLLNILGRKRQAAVTLYVDEQVLTAVLLFEGAYQVFAHPLSTDAMKRVNDYRSNLAKGENAIKQSFDPSEVGLALELLLPEEMIDTLLGADSLIVVPHGNLHFLPWAMIACRGKPLCTHLAVSVVPNLSVLMKTSELPAAAKGVSLVGASPARQAPINVAEQCSVIAKIFSSQGSPPSDAVAKTRDTFMGLLHGPQQPGEILYIACHGAFNLVDPMSSSLSLEDGRIDAASILRGRCAFDEVVLSACETGQRALEVGDVELAGDEILGLIGSFLEAGAKSVLASISQAKDKAALEMMKLYHEERARGELPRHALRKAQVAMYEKKWRYPVHEWGGFTLFGSC